MLSDRNLDSNSQAANNPDELLELCRELADELAELERFSSLIYAAWTQPDEAVKPSDDWFYSSDDRVESMVFLLTLFCHRFPFKSIREMSDNAHTILTLVKEIERKPTNKKGD